MRQRSDVIRNRQAILEAATRLYERSDGPVAIKMDDVAAAAGVGKGTVFRRFGDRTGLLQAVFDDHLQALKDAIRSGPPPLGPTTPARERVGSILIAVVDFKIKHRRLTRELENLRQQPRARTFFETDNYRWTHELLTDLLTETIGVDAASFRAHALLSLTRIDLIEHLIETQHYSDDQLHRHILDCADQIAS